MNFKEAFEIMKNGGEIGKKDRPDSCFYYDKKTKSVKTQVIYYSYFFLEQIENNILSDGWTIIHPTLGEDKENVYKFYEIAEYLNAGYKAKHKSFENEFIFYDNNNLTQGRLKNENYKFDFIDLLAFDWFEIKKD